ncbi:hypothetical protein HH1059_10900 [Halorhodospira halochloris]|uniref:Abortive infection protein-like C-terminal domain-containing protein n=3 Tax=Halorhodospira halochloris TaxID=1052 RepID=A0A2Z6EZK3_HALHR|nr:hypothetical protein HH1059_10900 [Halorhodospira halochloris]
MGYPRGFGYVLDFSDRTMEEFFEDEFGVEIYDEQNQSLGTSKRNCLTGFLLRADKQTALRVLRALWERREGLIDAAPSSADAREAKSKSGPFQEVIDYLEGDLGSPNTEGVETFERDRTLEELVADIERTLAANKPEVAIDHLHTYCMKKFAHLLKARGINCDKDEPLHSRFGKYRKCLEAEQDLPEFTVRALKSFISLLESFNDLRNNRSLAHDNEILKPAEARFIFSSISAILVMVRALEAARYGD